MTLRLTQNAIQASEKLGIKPQIVLEIDGITTVFGALKIFRFARIGDPGLFIGDYEGWPQWFIGGLVEHPDQEDLISFKGQTPTITQTLYPDKGVATSVSSLTIELLDSKNIFSEIVSPGVRIEDIIGTKCKVRVGFQDTSFPEDYVEIFNGMVGDFESGAGRVLLNLRHPDEKKRNAIFRDFTTDLNGNILATGSVTILPLQSTSGFMLPTTRPDGSPETAIQFYARINDEIFRYTGKTSNSLTGVSRASLATAQAAHQIGDRVSSFYTLEGDAMTLALKIMLSGWGGPFVSGVEVESFNRLSAEQTVQNAIFFFNENVRERYGLVEGDFVTVTGSAHAQNNVTLKPILFFGETLLGTFIVLDGVNFSTEPETSATVSFRSKYDTLPAGAGLRMSPDEVDVEQHEYYRRVFLSGFNYRFFMRSSEDGKKFIEEQLYAPCAAYAVPRKGRASVGLHTPPLPRDEILRVDKDDVMSPADIRLKRGISRHYINVVTYRFDESVLGGDLRSVHGVEAGDPRAKLITEKVGVKELELRARGMRSDLLASASAQLSANRRLQRYQFGAEYISSLRLLFKKGFRLEAGDVVLFDPEGLKITETKNGTREKESILCEVVNVRKSLEGDTSVDIVDTNFDGAARYGFISPASLVRSGESESEFTVKESFGSRFGVNEWRKWQDLIGASVQVRNDSFTRYGKAKIQSISGNTIKLTANLGFTPQQDDIMELSPYNDQPREVKLLYAFMTDQEEFDDGGPQYRLI
jgi:hypothetical protein